VRHGDVYFIQIRDDGPIKIGWSANARERLVTLQTACPDRLRLVGSISGTVDDERGLHARFEALRRVGEWFDPGPTLLAFIAGLPRNGMLASSRCSRQPSKR
jgi:hypothetical protein